MPRDVDTIGALLLLFAGIALAAHLLRRSLRRREHERQASILNRAWRRHVR